MQKLEIAAIKETQALDEGCALRVQIGPRAEAVLTLSREAEKALLLNLLARVHTHEDDLAAEHLQIKPCDVDRFLPPLGGVGLRFYLDKRTALHVVLPLSLAKALARMIDTFHEAGWAEPATGRRTR